VFVVEMALESLSLFMGQEHSVLDYDEMITVSREIPEII
jgi:hypothetical protein